MKGLPSRFPTSLILALMLNSGVFREVLAFADEFTTTTAAATTLMTSSIHHRELTDWLNDLPGGYFNPKQEIRPVKKTATLDGDDYHNNNNDSNGKKIFYGVYAKEFIAEGELLNQVPWDYIINDNEVAQSLAAAHDDSSSSFIKCGTVRNLAKEMRNMENSIYRPYIRHLMEQPRGVLPSAWTKRGMAMFEEVLGGSNQKIPPFDATSWLEQDWLDGCHADPNDLIGSHAAMQIVSRADDNLLIPVYDMYNHRNGPWYNTHMKLNRGVNHQLTARRDIQPGEQIHNSYNMCDECGGRKEGYGTPEIFRDYGFIEEFPQRWDLSNLGFVFDLYKAENGTVLISWEDGRKSTSENRMRALAKELKRLYKIRHVIWENEWNDGQPSIPMNEWDSIWEFHQAAVDAISYALNDLANNDSEKVPIGGKQNTCSLESCSGDYFDSLDDEPDDIKYNKRKCDNKELMTFPNYFELEKLKTHYQVLDFAARESDGDLCLGLENILQICSSYRPHYHEFSAHFAARFVDTVKRIIFVGGGDSMLLHESLKYPNLEKVVGLELDQTVTRKTFKYLRTQPHFDNDKVEWWFGDATKSLLLLPKEYWGSFDLVLVDLSETVMAFSVTEDLDVFDALALLLKPDGVMVKNEFYMNEMSETFDYTLQIHLDNNPKICSQVMAFGSNGADFFHQPVKDQNVETLLLPSVVNLKDGFDYFHDYRMNNARDNGKCDLDSKRGRKEEQGRSAGILHVLDAENVTVPLDSTALEKMILAVGKEQGFTLVSIPMDRPEGTSVGATIVVFQEGYVLARTWEEYNYCALDLGIWGGFAKESTFQKRLAESLKAKILSSFRVVVGGMYGSSTWQEDIDTIGPQQIVQRPSCDDSDKTHSEFSSIEAIRVLVEESVNMADSNKMIAGVICGIKGKDVCISVDALEKNSKIQKIIPIWTCASLTGENEGPERLMNMFECQNETISAIQDALEDSDSFDMIVLDASTPLIMGQIMNSILTVPKYRDTLLSDFNIFLAWSNKPSSETWQHNFLERYRKDILHDPITRAEMKVRIGDEAMEFGLVSSGDLAIFRHLHILEKQIERRLRRDDYPVSVEVVKIQGGLPPYNHNFNPKEFHHTDYDQEPGDKQYAEQQPFGREAIIQFELNGKKEDVKMPELEEIKQILDSTLSTLKYEVTRSETYTAVGDGALMLAEFKEGNVVLVWDGRDHIDVNLFLFDDSKEMADAMASSFVHFTQGNMQVGLRDDFPRGLGRVINFKEDLQYQGFDSITDRRPYVR